MGGRRGRAGVRHSHFLVVVDPVSENIDLKETAGRVAQAPPVLGPRWPGEAGVPEAPGTGRGQGGKGSSYLPSVRQGPYCLSQDPHWGPK